MGERLVGIAAHCRYHPSPRLHLLLLVKTVRSLSRLAAACTGQAVAGCGVSMASNSTMGSTAFLWMGTELFRNVSFTKISSACNCLSLDKHRTMVEKQREKESHGKVKDSFLKKKQWNVFINLPRKPKLHYFCWNVPMIRPLDLLRGAVSKFKMNTAYNRMILTATNRSTRRKICPIPISSTTNATWTSPGSNTGHHPERKTTVSAMALPTDIFCESTFPHCFF